MQVFRGFQILPTTARGAVAAIGNFDGIHLGHGTVLNAAAEIAAKNNAALAVITFEPHPRNILAQGPPTVRLTPPRRKLEVLKTKAVQQVMILRFSPQLMAMTAEEFVEQVLHKQFGLTGIVSGGNFRFGHRRMGDFDALSRLTAACGIQSRAVEPLVVEGAACSSSRVRQALSDGDIELVTALLGRPHQIIGMVRTGERRGRELGFPTANTYPLPSSTAMPATGIYTVSAQVMGEAEAPWLDAVASLGRNPTFVGLRERLEVHILDTNSLDLYGKRLRVVFHERLRGEEQYPSIDALVAQIAKDCDQARRTHAKRKSDANCSI